MSAEKITEMRLQIMELRKQIAALQKVLPKHSVNDYTFTTLEGEVKLSTLFGDHDNLFMVHNMGISCNYCMLWSDGFNGVAGHLQNRAAFVISSPDSPDVQQQHKSERGWQFPMVSVENNTFAGDMGFHSDDGYMPGVSVFKREGKKVVRVASSMFGPGDDFCAVWHLLDLLPEGSNGWQPEPTYQSA